MQRTPYIRYNSRVLFVHTCTRAHPVVCLQVIWIRSEETQGKTTDMVCSVALNSVLTDTTYGARFALDVGKEKVVGNSEQHKIWPGSQNEAKLYEYIICATVYAPSKQFRRKMSAVHRWASGTECERSAVWKWNEMPAKNCCLNVCISRHLPA